MTDKEEKKNEEKKETAIQLLKKDNVVVNFEKILGKEKAQWFISSALSVISNEKLLKDAKPLSVYNALMIAASLDLPINPNLWLAYIIPYKGEAQFQVGYKGFVQLALRSWEFHRINSVTVYEGQLIEENPITGNKYDRSVKSDKAVGYLAYFKLRNGFEAEFYMTKDEAEKHGKEYSQTYKKWFWLRKDKFDSMAQKTVLKLLLSKYAPLSTQMQRAVEYDQAVVKDKETLEVEYADNTPTLEDWNDGPKTDYKGKIYTNYPDHYKADMTEEQAKDIYFSLLNKTNDTDGNQDSEIV